MLQERQVEPALELRRALGLERVVAEGREDDTRRIGAALARVHSVERADGILRAGLDARGAVRAAEAELIEPARLGEEALVGDDVREARLGVDDTLERR